MNIWYLSAHDQPRGRSSRTYDFSLELIRRGHRVTMFTSSFCHWTHTEKLGPEEKWRIEEIDGVRVVWLRTIPYKGNGLSRGINMISNAMRSIQVAGELDDVPDVVIGPSVPLGTGWAAWRIAAARRAAFVFEVRDVWPIALVDDGGLSRHHPVYYAFRMLEKKLYRMADRISSVLPFLNQHVADSGSDPAKVSWVPNGIVFERFNCCANYDGGCTEQLVAMYVGGFGQAHDVITVVRAAGLLQQLGEHRLRFIIVGNGVDRPRCEQEAKHLGLTNIEFRDSVEKSAVPLLQTEADILIAAVKDSPIYRFGMNLNKVFDYLAAGRPIVFSGRARNDQVIEAGAGLSVAPEDPAAMAGALRALLGMAPAERQAMGQRGRHFVNEKFDMRQLAARMEHLLNQAATNKGR